MIRTRVVPVTTYYSLQQFGYSSYGRVLRSSCARKRVFFSLIYISALRGYVIQDGMLGCFSARRRVGGGRWQREYYILVRILARNTLHIPGDEVPLMNGIYARRISEVEELPWP